jgi:hypothetical protein
MMLYAGRTAPCSHHAPTLRSPCTHPGRGLGRGLGARARACGRLLESVGRRAALELRLARPQPDPRPRELGVCQGALQLEERTAALTPGHAARRVTIPLRAVRTLAALATLLRLASPASRRRCLLWRRRRHAPL